MALIRAEIRQRLGDSSIYDGVVEYPEDFENERMLASVHPGSLMICLNHQEGSDEGDEVTSDLYIKLEDGSWGIMKGSGGGGEVTPESVAKAIGEMTDTQKAQALDDLGGAPEMLVVRFTNNGSYVTADHDVDAILNALDAGRIVVGVFEGLHVQLAASNKSPNIATFIGVYVNSDGRIEVNELEGITDGRADTWTQNISSAEIPTMVTFVSGATPSITPADKHFYKCGTLTSLTITDPPATGAYSIVFTSGSTATTTTIPATILGLENFAPEANTIYEINVLDNRAVVGSWAVSA